MDFLFMAAFIILIWFSPWKVKCSLLYIISATLQKKSWDFTPSMGYLTIVMSPNFETIYSITPFFRYSTRPHWKYFIKLLINSSSLECWESIKTKGGLMYIWKPIECVLLAFILTMKHPSALVKPANHSGSLCNFPWLGLSTGRGRHIEVYMKDPCS